MAGTAFLLAVVLLIAAGVLALQYVLSKSESKWLGLIIPAISVMYSIIMVCGLVYYDGMKMSQMIFSVASVFLMANIPTAVLLAIYLAVRRGKRKYKEMDKMNIKDL